MYDANYIPGWIQRWMENCTVSLRYKPKGTKLTDILHCTFISKRILVILFEFRDWQVGAPYLKSLYASYWGLNFSLILTSDVDPHPDPDPQNLVNADPDPDPGQ